MFRDLKEYQQIQKIYEESVCLTEEDKSILDEIENLEFSDEELYYISENIENIDEIIESFNLTERAGLARMIGGVLKRTVGNRGLMNRVSKIKSNIGKGFKGLGNTTKRKPFDAVKTKNDLKSRMASAFDKNKNKIPANMRVGDGSGVKRVLGTGAAVAGTGALATAVVNKLRSKPEVKKDVLTDKDKSDIKKENELQKVIKNKKNLQKIETNAKKKEDAKDAKEVEFRLKNTETSEQSAKAEAKPKRKPVPSPMEAGMGSGAAKARELAKRRLAKKKEANMEEYTPYDLVLNYLISTEQAATIEEANYVMTEMDAETIQSIVEEQKKNLDEALGRAGLGALKAIGRFGAKSPKNFAITMAGTGLVGQKVVKPVVTKLANALNPTPKTDTSNITVDKKKKKNNNKNNLLKQGLNVIKQAKDNPGTGLNPSTRKALELNKEYEEGKR